MMETIGQYLIGACLAILIIAAGDRQPDETRETEGIALPQHMKTV